MTHSALNNYLDAVQGHLKSGHASEHTYRGDLAVLLKNLTSNVHITNEPSRVTDCGNPDYVLTKGDIPIGFVEAKDIGKDLNSKQYAEQFDRYRKALDNLIITDYLWFQFFQQGELVHEIRIAEVTNGKLTPLSQNFDQFTNLILDFCSFVSQTIKSPQVLAEMMAAKARLLENILEHAVSSDEELEVNTDLKNQYESFKRILIHDLTPKAFADLYAQTLAYGMFAARLHDHTLETFSRQEAAEKIPKSNPFLRKLFIHLAGADIDERIKTTVDNLAEVFRATDVRELLKNFGKATQTLDPIIHFYETFLAAYDPKLRKVRGVWYTPAPVVEFIVRGVDHLLKSEFKLDEGLADTSKIKIKVQTQTKDARTASGFKDIEKEVHKVQVLDPATGTGTFLAEVIKFIHNEKFCSMQGAWSDYVDSHLIPRLNGFELLMASYSMAHLKLDLLLSETGYTTQKHPRFNIYLTNSLTEHHPDSDTLFSQWLSLEANEANAVKRDTPVMVVLGNPPYLGESTNKGEWIMDLMKDYKKEPGGKQKLQETNSKWVNDDYVKFIRYAQHYIEKNGEGVLAYICPHGFLDNPTFRGMRWNLLKTFDKIYTLDLHGNSKKKETSPDGSKDENVFDIQQGVSINFFIKQSTKSNKLAEVWHADLFGLRDHKYSRLRECALDQIDYMRIDTPAPMHFFVPKDFEALKTYETGFALNELFPVNSVGIVTARDAFTIHEKKEKLISTIDQFLGMKDEEARNHFGLGKDVQDWQVALARKDLELNNPNSACVTQISYRPFDDRWTFYTGKSKGFHCRARGEVMQHMLQDTNIALILKRQSKKDFSYCFLSNKLAESCLFESAYANNSVLPLYVNSELCKIGDYKRVPNLDPEITKQIAESIGLNFEAEKSGDIGHFAPIDLLDYIYAVLHSPSYRETYKEFLKIDFPKVPYPASADQFWRLVELGGELREIHLLKHPSLKQPIAKFPLSGSGLVERKMSKNSIGFEASEADTDMGKVWINNDQYFEGVPKIAWEFYIGGYQPAQKWLKDRVGQVLSYEDISHYLKIVKALNRTHELMQQIDQVEVV